MWCQGNADQSDSYCEDKAWWLRIMQVNHVIVIAMPQDSIICHYIRAFYPLNV